MHMTIVCKDKRNSLFIETGCFRGIVFDDKHVAPAEHIVMIRYLFGKWPCA